MDTSTSATRLGSRRRSYGRGSFIQILGVTRVEIDSLVRGGRVEFPYWRGPRVVEGQGSASKSEVVEGARVPPQPRRSIRTASQLSVYAAGLNSEMGCDGREGVCVRLSALTRVCSNSGVGEIRGKWVAKPKTV